MMSKCFYFLVIVATILALGNLTALWAIPWLFIALVPFIPVVASVMAVVIILSICLFAIVIAGVLFAVFALIIFSMEQYEVRKYKRPRNQNNKQ